MTSINMAAIKRRPESRDNGQRCAKSGEGIIGATSKERLAANVYTSRSSAPMRHEDSGRSVPNGHSRLSSVVAARAVASYSATSRGGGDDTLMVASLRRGGCGADRRPIGGSQSGTVAGLCRHAALG